MWPVAITRWVENRTLYLSIPFTWLLDQARSYALQTSFEYDSIVVGGPAVCLIPEFFDDLPHVTVKYWYEGVLQKVNPLATRTSAGCTNKCGFCGVKKIELFFQEFEDWPDRPVLCDNNILACSQAHFDKVCDRLERHGWCDFNQGIDARLLTDYHAERLKRIGRPLIRLALDNMAMCDDWVTAYILLRGNGISKRLIRSYCLIGYKDNPETAWKKCKFVEYWGIKPLPMWYHSLDAMKCNIVTKEQENNGWNDYERRRIMQWFYKHKKAVK